MFLMQFDVIVPYRAKKHPYNSKKGKKNEQKC